MTVTYDNAGDSGYHSGTTTRSVTFNVAADANYILGWIAQRAIGTAFTATFDGVAMTLIDTIFSAANLVHQKLYGVSCVGHTGAGKVMTISWTGSCPCAAGAASFKGVRQTRPYNAPAHAASDYAASISCAPVSSVGDLVFACGMGNSAWSSDGAGQTMRTYESTLWTRGTTKAGDAGTTTMTYNLTIDRCSIIGVALIPPSTAGIWYFFKRLERFARDLKAGLVPPDILRQRYGDLMTI